MLLSIVIPCLNEEKTVVRAVRQAQQASKLVKNARVEIIVADNGSTDRSVLKLQKQGIARIIKVPVKGYGAALHWGILKAKGKFVLYADADLSYSFKDLKVFLPFLTAKNSADLVLGSRFRGKIMPGAMPLHHRYLGTPVLTALIRAIYHLPTTDCNSGMRLVRRSFYQQLKMKNAGMEWASELLLRTALKKGKYREVPITLHRDQRNKKPHLLSWSDGWRHLKAIVLLKPNLLFGVTAGVFVFSGLLAMVPSSVSIFFGLLGVVLFFCALAAKLIKFAIDQEESEVALALMRLPLVPAAILLSVMGIFQFLFLPPEWQVVKVVASTIILMYLIWVFFIETIKTHLVNKLPPTINSFKL